MRITFFSNYFNHHQKALCDALDAIDGVDFRFVETEPMEAFRSGMGWGKEDTPSYVLKAHLSDENREKAMELSLSSDVVMIGSAPEEYVRERIEKDLLTFRYTERPMKEGWIKMFIPRLGLKFYRLHYKNRQKKLFLLGASAYAAADYAILRSYPGKCLRFGYFPSGEELPEEAVMEQKRGRAPLKILWTGRFLKLKRADLLIKALWGLKLRGLDFTASLVGDGETKEELTQMVKKYSLEDRVSFSGFVSPDEVRALMRGADIYVMTSNFLEGWGSVIYESLSEGCAVVASHACGCTNWLVKPGKTGLVFKSGDAASLEDKLVRFVTDDELRRNCQRGAFEQMKKLWNPRVAAERLAEFSKAVIDGGRLPDFGEGPLGPAEILKNDWYRD